MDTNLSRFKQVFQNVVSTLEHHVDQTTSRRAGVQHADEGAGRQRHCGCTLTQQWLQCHAFLHKAAVRFRIFLREPRYSLTSTVNVGKSDQAIATVKNGRKGRIPAQQLEAVFRNQTNFIMHQQRRGHGPRNTAGVGIVNKSRGNTDRHRPASALFVLLKYQNVLPCLGEVGRSDQRVMARTNYDHII